jgi:small subunit ribosomal protein S8e
MVIIQAKPHRKSTGSRYKSAVHKKTLAQFGCAAAFTKLGDIKVDDKRITGGHVKKSVMSSNKVNVYDPAKKVHAVAQIKTITDNSANKNFVRRNIMTKGAIIDTNLGKARITNRPGQEGTLNAVLIGTK